MARFLALPFFYSKDWSLFLFDVVLAIVDGCKDISPVIPESALTQMADDIAQYKGRSPKQPNSFLFYHYFFAITEKEAALDRTLHALSIQIVPDTIILTT